jgi:UDP-perosamine 4-acetyltransferase
VNDRGELVIFGAGGHAAVVADAAVAAGFVIAGVLAEPRPPADGRSSFGGVPWLGDPDHPGAALDDLLARGALVHAAVGEPTLRRRWLECRMSSAVAIVHPTAVISPSATIEPGTFVGPGAVVNARAAIASGAIVNTAAVVEHDVRVGPFAHVAPGSILLGAASVGRNAFIGAGAVVLPGVAIGDEATLGAGGVATRGVPDGVLAIGVPARPA